MPSNKLFAQLLSKFEPNDVPLPIELGCNSVDHVTAAPATVPSTRQGKIIKSRPITGEKLQPDFQSRLSLLSQANPPQIPLPDGRGCVATVAGKLVGVSSSEGSVHNLQRRSVVAEKRKLFEKEQRREAIEVVINEATADMDCLSICSLNKTHASFNRAENDTRPKSSESGTHGIHSNSLARYTETIPDHKDRVDVLSSIASFINQEEEDQGDQQNLAPHHAMAPSVFEPNEDPPSLVRRLCRNNNEILTRSRLGDSCKLIMTNTMPKSSEPNHQIGGAVGAHRPGKSNSTATGVLSISKMASRTHAKDNSMKPISLHTQRMPKISSLQQKFNGSASSSASLPSLWKRNPEEASVTITGSEKCPKVQKSETMSALNQKGATVLKTGNGDEAGWPMEKHDDDYHEASPKSGTKNNNHRLKDTIGIFESLSRQRLLEPGHSTHSKPSSETPTKGSESKLSGGRPGKARTALRKISTQWGRSRPRRKPSLADPYHNEVGGGLLTAESQIDAISDGRQNVSDLSDGLFQPRTAGTNDMTDEMFNGVGLHTPETVSVPLGNDGCLDNSILNHMNLDANDETWTFIHCHAPPTSDYGVESVPYVRPKLSTLGIDNHLALHRRNVNRRWISRSSGPMIAKVHCELEQPKPVRAREMRRLASLCRDRVTGRAVRAQTE